MPDRRRRARSAAVALVAGAAALAAAPGASARSTPPAYAAARSVPLPVPVHDVPALPGIGLTRDRLLVSRVPGAVRDQEDVLVAVGPDGAPRTVVVDQALELTGTGDYAIRERGPARAAVPVGDTVPPVLKLGTVVWQGFSPGRRSLHARLTLDAGLEAARLPLAVRLELRTSDGRVVPIAPGGRAPVDGTVTVTLANQSAGTSTLAAGQAAVGPLAQALDALRTAALHPRPGPPPAAGAGLPRALPGTAIGSASAVVVAPLRVSGTVRVPGAPVRVDGPGLTALPDGARLQGTLTGTVAFTVPVHAGQAVALDLDVQPWIDPRTLVPPGGRASWAAWAAAGPSPEQVASATTVLVTQAAAAARSAEYTPYLGAALPGASVTTFRYTVAPAAAAPAVVHRMRPRPVGIAAAVVALLAITANGVLLRRAL